MAFPEDPLPIVQEMLIDGVWTSVVDDTRNAPDVVIRRGYSSEQAALSAASALFTLDNREYKYSNRNPESPYYRKLGRNTQYRAGITGDTVSLRLADYSDSDGVYDGARVWTADKAVLDITGDLDLRIDCEPDDWRGGDGYFLASKYVTSGDQRSWTWLVTATGRLRLIWSTDGTVGARVFVSSTEPVPDGGRYGLRVTLDVNNGAAGNTVTFYTSDTIGGSWTQLGDPVVTSGVTSVFSSSANLEVGTIMNGADRGATIANPTIVPFVGRIYGFELRNGIGGTLVADMDATGQAAGTTSWSDGLGTPNTWTITNSAELTAVDYRFWGETAKIPQRADTSGRDVTAPVQTADIVQRLMTGQKALDSPIRQNLTQFNLDAYHPMEDGPETEYSTAVVGLPGYFRNASFGSVDLPGSSGGMTFNSDDGGASGLVARGYLPPTGTAYAQWYFTWPTPSALSYAVMNVYLTGGDIPEFWVEVSSTNYILRIYDANSIAVDEAITGFGGYPPTEWVGMRVVMTQNGADVDWEWAWYGVGALTITGISGTLTNRTLGRPHIWRSNAFVGKSGMQLAHVVLAREELNFEGDEFRESTNGYIGEAADDRFARLCRQKRIPYWIVGRQTEGSGIDSTAEPMGAQRALPFLTLIGEAAALSGSLLYGPRDKFGLTMRMRASLMNRAPAVELSYTDGDLSGQIEPDEETNLIRNDVTVTRPTGGSARAVKTSGSLNVNDPQDDPDGVGLYDVPVDRVAASDEQLPGLAQREIFHGTWDEPRYAKISVELAQDQYVSDPAKTAAARAVDLGKPIRLTDTPQWLPPGDADVLVRGYTETLRNRGQVIDWNTTPYGPYRGNDLTLSDETRFRVAASNTVLASALTTTGTAAVLFTPSGKLWRRSAGAGTGVFPMPVEAAGEQMSVTDLANVTWAFVAAGTAAAGDANNQTPGLPGGLAAGDLMVMLASIRGTGDSVNVPTGWVSLAVTTQTNVRLLGKLAEAGEAAPNVTFGGYGAGDDTIAQIAAFRPSSPLAGTDLTAFVAASAWSTNASAQDIAYPNVPLSERFTDNSVVLYLGWKQDDWTSVASPGTEIAEPDTVAGNDAGQVWAYTIQTTATAVAAGSFVVTGGAAGVSKGAVVVLNTRHQAATVTRSANGIVKTQAAGEAVQVADPFNVL